MTQLTIIVPTRNEVDNVTTLFSRVNAAFADIQAEILVVDDSDDSTPFLVAEQAQISALPVRLLHRPRDERHGGLGSAVVAGARHARGEWVVVMDADLQHPPEVVAHLAQVAARHSADIVVGTRYAGNGSTGDGLDGARRTAGSSTATRLARALFPGASPPSPTR
ncbi:glycosyltransferase [Dactylosporangium cerinum]